MSRSFDLGRPPSDTDRIRRTLEFYDPDRLTVTVGTAALVLHGVRISYPVPDVDVLAPMSLIADLKAAVRHDGIDLTTYFTEVFADDYGFNFDGRIMLEPDELSPEAKLLLPFQAFTDMRDAKHTVSYEEVLGGAVVHAPTGHRIMPVDEVIRWKEAVGREKDRETLAGLSNLAIARSTQLQLFEIPKFCLPHFMSDRT